MHKADIIPAPVHLERDAGEFPVVPSTRIICDAQFAATSDLLASHLRTSTGYEFPVTTVGASAKIPPAHGPHGTGFDTATLEGGNICLIHSTSLEEEEYHLTVEPWGLRLLASHPRGMIHAVHTLLQLFPPAVFSPCPRVGIAWGVPCVRIQDKPRFAWRGAMLDCVRSFIPIVELKRLITVFALHHFNILQLHLTDDQGWRMEIKALPRLTEVGSKRAESHAGHRTLGKFDGVPCGGFYTQEELRDLVEFAAVRGITIVPEIDLPGHAAALLAAYPHLAAHEAPAAPASRFGILPHNLFPSPENLDFIAPIFEEVMNVFPGPYFHTGGDEVLPGDWLADPRTPELLRTYGLDSIKQLQPFFTRHVHKIASQNGKKLVGWEEILHKELPSDAIIMSWLGQTPPPEAGNYSTILAPHTHTYFDYYQGPDLASQPLAIGGATPLKKTYEYNPLSGNGEHPIAPVLGLQGQLWTEYQRTSHALEFMAFPRFCALAEVAWSASENRNWSGFLRRLDSQLRRFDVMEIAYRSLSVADWLED